MLTHAYLILCGICEGISHAWRRTHTHTSMKARWISHPRFKPKMALCLRLSNLVIWRKFLAGTPHNPLTCQWHFMRVNQHVATCKADSVCETGDARWMSMYVKVRIATAQGVEWFCGNWQKNCPFFHVECCLCLGGDTDTQNWLNNWLRSSAISVSADREIRFTFIVPE